MPRRISAAVPDWLAAAGCGDASSLQAWFDQMDFLFNCDSYLQTYFCTAERVREAETALYAARQEAETNVADEAVVAEWWRQNVGCVVPKVGFRI